VTITRTTAAAVVAIVFAVGSGAGYLWTQRAAVRMAAPAAPAGADATAAPRSTGIIQIPPDLVARAGIRVDAAATAAVAGAIRLSATVRPNAYRQVSVTPLVGGRVTRVAVELGQPVSRGTPIAEVYSPEAAEARAKYLNAQADTEAGDARLRRTERLAALGSASQQEVEQVRAEHVRHETELREAAAKLRLFGMDPSRLGDAHAEVASTITITAPQAGVITERPASTGMTVDPSTVLATIADLSRVWIIADLFERDFAHVAVGTAATATVAAYPGDEWRGRVTYISPEVSPETRTAPVRIEVANPGGKLKLGMFVNVAMAARPVTGVTIPGSAVQTIGADAVVFVPEGAGVGAYRERVVRLGPVDGDRVNVAEGLSAGDRVVTRGSFELRAEAERQGVRPAPAQAFAVAVTAAGFEPASLTVRRGMPARLTFTRKTEQTCATEVVMPAYGIRRPLPLNEPVTIEFVPQGNDATFQCGMGMFSGTLVVR
jgi:RND family efflux transporter MFP subunit